MGCNTSALIAEVLQPISFSLFVQILGGKIVDFGLGKTDKTGFKRALSVFAYCTIGGERIESK